MKVQSSHEGAELKVQSSSKGPELTWRSRAEGPELKVQSSREGPELGAVWGVAGRQRWLAAPSPEAHVGPSEVEQVVL